MERRKEKAKEQAIQADWVKRFDQADYRVLDDPDALYKSGAVFCQEEVVLDLAHGNFTPGTLLLHVPNQQVYRVEGTGEMQQHLKEYDPEECAQPSVTKPKLASQKKNEGSRSHGCHDHSTISIA
jgi:hypothetical protein